MHVPADVIVSYHWSTMIGAFRTGVWRGERQGCMGNRFRWVRGGDADFAREFEVFENAPICGRCWRYIKRKKHCLRICLRNFYFEGEKILQRVVGIRRSEIYVIRLGERRTRNVGWTLALKPISDAHTYSSS
jgi:hypothetical protein